MSDILPDLLYCPICFLTLMDKKGKYYVCRRCKRKMMIKEVKK